MKNRDNFKTQLDHWKRRGLVKDIINEDYLLEHFKDQSSVLNFTVYCGIDPTALSLHLGHLVPLKLLREFAKFGIKPIVLIGNTTALIGDPSFRSKQRKPSFKSEINMNAQAITEQIKQLVPEAIIISNKEWYEKLSVLEFMDKAGKCFSVKHMLQKKAFADAFKQGNLAYSNFSYILMQAYDFYYLYKHHNCLIQIGGSDQYPNIAFGVKAINRIDHNLENQHKRIAVWKEIKNTGITTNLLTNKLGAKISKTSENLIWLNSYLTSFYEMHQHLYNLDDHVAEQWLKIFDLDISDDDLKMLMTPEIKKTRALQKKLFQVISKWIYPTEKIQKFQTHDLKEITRLLKEKNPQEIKKFKQYLNSIWMPFVSSINVVSLLINSKIVTSTSQALKLLSQKAVKVNYKIVTDPKSSWTRSDFFNGYLLLQKGKKILKLFDFNNS